MDKKYCVYMHISPEGLRYVGKSSRKPKSRWIQGNRYTKNKDFYADILHHGGEDQFLSVFQHYILSPAGSWFEWEDSMSTEDTNFFTQEEAAELERKWIAHYKALEPAKIYNRSSGGDRGYTYDPIAKERNREAHIGLYDGDKNPMFGKKQTSEARKKISESAKQRTGDKNHMTGKQHTDEAKEKNRKAHLGLYDGEKNPMFGKKQTDEAKEKISETNSKPISMYSLDGQFIQTFHSVSSASEAMGVAIQSISMCATKATKTCCDKIWRYFECEQLPPSEMPPKHKFCKSISQYDLQGNYLKTFESLKAAAQTTSISSTAILNAAKGRTQKAGNYIWRYESPKDK